MKTTKQDFADFTKHALEWQDRLGLTNWKLYFYHRHVDGSYADCSWDAESSVATIRLSTNWEPAREKSQDELRLLALHEVLHVFTAELCCYAEARYTTRSQIDTAEHSMIRRLENILMPSQ